jgi:hypothetical protein
VAGEELAAAGWGDGAGVSSGGGVGFTFRPRNGWMPNWISFSLRIP